MGEWKELVREKREGIGGRNPYFASDLVERFFHPRHAPSRWSSPGKANLKTLWQAR